jgi:hypothetical protein
VAFLKQQDTEVRDAREVIEEKDVQAATTISEGVSFIPNSDPEHPRVSRSLSGK